MDYSGIHLPAHSSSCGLSPSSQVTFHQDCLRIQQVVLPIESELGESKREPPNEKTHLLVPWSWSWFPHLHHIQLVRIKFLGPAHTQEIVTIQEYKYLSKRIIGAHFRDCQPHSLRRKTLDKGLSATFMNYWAVCVSGALIKGSPTPRPQTGTDPPKSPAICGKIAFHETGPWCRKCWGPLPLIISSHTITLFHCENHPDLLETSLFRIPSSFFWIMIISS